MIWRKTSPLAQHLVRLSELVRRSGKAFRETRALNSVAALELCGVMGW